MEVYIDDMLIKSTKSDYHIADLEDAFNELRQYQIKLNPNKCAFRLYQESSLAS